MEVRDAQFDCQIPCLQRITTGPAKGPRQSLARRLKLFVRRRLSPRRERLWKTRTNRLMNWVSGLMGQDSKPATSTDSMAVERLQAGDRVQVRSKEEIERTLDHWRQFKGCTFMSEMWQYCGTTQRVLKRMEKFVDERDLRVKKSRGIVLLQGLLCEGTAEFGPCDRSCHYFWREEWLEKMPE
jgi:hypothetical protein